MYEIFDNALTELVNYDRAFIVLHGRGGEDGQIQGVLEWLNVPYTGTGVQGSAIGMDKVKTKQVWQGSELPTAPYRIVTKDSNPADIVAALGLPLIIKPVHEGSSIGMSKVERIEDFAEAIAKATEHDAVVMAEKWITGREFTIVLLNGQALPVIRLEPPKDVAFYDYEAKYNRNDVQYVAMDMWKPYRDAVTDVIPQAKVVVDKFHVVRMANDSMERVRKSMKADLTLKQKRGLMHDRFVLLRRFPAGLQL